MGGNQWESEARRGEARRVESSRVESSVWCVWRWYRDKMKEPRSLYPTYMTVLLRTSKHNVMRCRYTARYIFQTWVFALYREGDIRIPPRDSPLEYLWKPIESHFGLNPPIKIFPYWNIGRMKIRMFKTDFQDNEIIPTIKSHELAS